jgi:hypothetical protein
MCAMNLNNRLTKLETAAGLPCPLCAPFKEADEIFWGYLRDRGFKVDLDAPGLSARTRQCPECNQSVLEDATGQTEEERRLLDRLWEERAECVRMRRDWAGARSQELEALHRAIDNRGRARFGEHYDAAIALVDRYFQDRYPTGISLEK